LDDGCCGGARRPFNQNEIVLRIGSFLLREERYACGVFSNVCEYGILVMEKGAKKRMCHWRNRCFENVVGSPS